MDLRYSVRVAISGVAGWLAVQWVTRAGLDNALLHAVVIFIVVSLFWARPLLDAARNARRGRSSVGERGQSEPTPVA
mgnify:CR=1 FL=1